MCVCVLVLHVVSVVATIEYMALLYACILCFYRLYLCESCGCL